MIRRAVVRLARQALRVPLVRRGALGALRAAAQPMSTIFMLHRFTDPAGAVDSRDAGAVLRSAFSTLRRQGVELLPLGDLITRLEQGIPSTRPTVSFTVDDGYHDFFTAAAPIFAEFDCPVTVFLATDVISSRGWYWWDRIEYAVLRSTRPELALTMGGSALRIPLGAGADRQRTLEALIERVKFLADAERRQIAAEIGRIAEVDVPEHPPEHYRTLDWAEVRALERAGVTFGPHSCSHPILSRVDDATARREIFDSWRAVQRECAAPVPVFCYPNGTVASFGPRDESLVREAGLRGAVSFVRARVDPSKAQPSVAFRLPRYEMPADPFDVAWLVAAIRERA